MASVRFENEETSCTHGFSGGGVALRGIVLQPHRAATASSNVGLGGVGVVEE